MGENVGIVCCYLCKLYETLGSGRVCILLISWNPLRTRLMHCFTFDWDRIDDFTPSMIIESPYYHSGYIERFVHLGSAHI